MCNCQPSQLLSAAFLKLNTTLCPDTCGGHLVCLHSPATRWQKQSPATSHLSRVTNVVTMDQCFTTPHLILVSGCRLSDRLTAWDLMTRAGQCCTWGGEEEIWSRWCLNRFLGDGEQWLMGARINIYNSFTADRVSQKTMCWISINKGIMTLHVVWTALGTRVFPTYFKVAQAHFSPPLLHAITI